MRLKGGRFFVWLLRHRYGVLAVNMMAADINAYIRSSHVTGKSVLLTADDTSRIMAYGGAAAITGGEVTLVNARYDRLGAVVDQHLMGLCSRYQVFPYVDS